MLKTARNELLVKPFSGSGERETILAADVLDCGLPVWRPRS
jgi:hypothetical protein